MGGRGIEERKVSIWAELMLLSEVFGSLASVL